VTRSKSVLKSERGEELVVKRGPKNVSSRKARRKKVTIDEEKDAKKSAIM